jgi:hypothetical protein
MASTDARPVPRKNVAYRHYFAVRKNDGTLITTWTGQDSEVSLDGAAFGDCTNEATEVGASGCGYIDFTSAEMNADAVQYKLTVTNTGALPIVLTFFPEESGDYRVDGASVADAVLSRNVSNVEGSAPEHSLCTIVLATLEYAVSGTTWTIKRTDGSTTHATKTLTTAAGADSITGVN